MRCCLGICAAALCAACAPFHRVCFVDDVVFGWGCNEDRTFVATEHGGSIDVLIEVGALPYDSQERYDQATTTRYESNGVVYEIREELRLTTTHADRFDADPESAGEGRFENCRVDSAVAD